MKKTEIIQLALVVLGIGIIFRTFVYLIQQISVYIRLTSAYAIGLMEILGVIFSMTILILLGYLIIARSEILANKIFKEENDQKIDIALSKSEIIHVSVIILCLYFLISLFPTFFSSMYIVLFEFVDNFKQFKELLFQRIGTLIIYFTIIVILTNSKRFSIWLDEKLVH